MSPSAYETVQLLEAQNWLFIWTLQEPDHNGVQSILVDPNHEDIFSFEPDLNPEDSRSLGFRPVDQMLKSNDMQLSCRQIFIKYW